MRLALIHQGNDRVLLEYDPAQFQRNVRESMRKKAPFIGPTRREFLKAFDEAWAEVMTDFKQQSIYL